MIRICPERDAQCLNGMACAEPCAGSSSETLKKVLLAICENKGRTSGDLADAILTALASGSGDHEELALNAKAAQTWALGIYENREQAKRRSKFIDSDLPATVLALLAEIAALRARENELIAGHAVAVTAMARKLAEAVGLLRRIDRTYADMQDGNGNHPTELRKVRTFLSKEAERG